jgi:stage IV sporulation protein B
MVLKKIKNTITTLLIIFSLFIPNYVLAYSSEIIASGKNIGIELESSGIIIVGTYEIGNKNPAGEANLKNGDKIISVNGTSVSSIEEMLDAIDLRSDDSSLDITYLRGSKELTTSLKLEKDSDNVYKTGLYVKDSINGVGTLTFIDPNTKIYGALGHEITEKTTGQKLDIKDGKIYESTVTGITPSKDGDPGEKNVNYDTSKVYGSVSENTEYGIFGTYTEEITDDSRLYKVAQFEDIELGSATMLTVIEDNTVNEYDINIIKLNKDSTGNKNILFEITDEELLQETGGIIQGMSGSPIIQGDYIIGAVTHVVVDDPTKGYGILITNMLEEAEN